MTMLNTENKMKQQLNDVLNDDFCNISDECIEYFKSNLMNLNKLYNDNVGNRLKYFTMATNLGLINIGL